RLEGGSPGPVRTERDPVPTEAPPRLSPAQRPRRKHRLLRSMSHADAGGPPDSAGPRPDPGRPSPDRGRADANPPPRRRRRPARGRRRRDPEVLPRPRVAAPVLREGARPSRPRPAG